MSLLSLYRSGHAPVESLRACESELRRVRFVAWREIRKAEKERDEAVAALARYADEESTREADRDRLAAALERIREAILLKDEKPIRYGDLVPLINDIAREALNPGVKIEKDSFGFRYERKRFWLDPESWPQEFKDWLEEYVQEVEA